MNTSVVSPPEARARAVEFVPDAFVVHLQDGRSLTVPIEWFPRLRDASPEQRNHWRLIGPASAFTGRTSTRTSRWLDSWDYPTDSYLISCQV
jgi:hypothetical protein